MTSTRRRRTAAARSRPERIFVATGFDEGGTLPGTALGTFTIVPLIVDAVQRVPVMAAGGITDARGARAVHALGAEGVFAGSVFISTIESRVPDSVKAKIVAANGLDLRLFRTPAGLLPRVPGKLSDTLVAMDRAGASRTELAQAMGGLRGMRLGMLEGNTDEGYISVGAGIGNIHAITSVAEVGQPAGGVKPPAGARQPARSGVGHLLYRPGESVDSQSDVGGGDRLRRVMADAPRQRTNSIADGQRSAMAIASCPCAARQRQGTPLHRLHRLAQHRLQVTVAGGGGDAIILLGGETQLAAPGNGLRLPQQFLQQRRQRRILRAANIQRQLHLARYHVHRARRTAQGADRRHRGYRRAAGSGFPPAPSIPPPRRGRPCDGASAPCRHGQLRR